MMDVLTARRRFRLMAEALAYDQSPSSPPYVALGEYLSAIMDSWCRSEISDDELIVTTLEVEDFLTKKLVPY